MTRRAWWIAAILVLVTNLVVLLGVARNRLGTPDATVVLSDRELTFVDLGDENSGMAVRLRYDRSEASDRLDRPKLEACGFDFSVPLDAEGAEFHYEKQLPRPAFVVFELGGESWDRWLESQREELDRQAERVASGELARVEHEARQERFESERRTRSRLFAVDAGLDPASLRDRYPENDRFLVLPAVIRTDVFRGPLRVVGRIVDLGSSRIYLGSEEREPLEALRSRSTPGPASEGVRPPGERVEPRVEVTLKVGRRHEPWVDRVRILD
jgi:hypothetical protein